MPFRSQAQRSFMYARHPAIAKRWSAEYPNQGPLPQHASGKDQVIHALMKRKMGR